LGDEVFQDFKFVDREDEAIRLAVGLDLFEEAIELGGGVVGVVVLVGDVGLECGGEGVVEFDREAID
jgi:hypothetical protein